MKYWAYINNEILGPYEKEELMGQPSFNASSLICPQTPIGEKTEDWKAAGNFPEIAAMISAASQEKTDLPSAPPPPPPPLPKVEEPQTKESPKTEYSHPVFNQNPEIKFKPISPQSLESAPPAPVQDTNINIPVNHLESIKDQPARSFPVESQTPTLEVPPPAEPRPALNFQEEPVKQPSPAPAPAPTPEAAAIPGAIAAQLEAIAKHSLGRQDIAEYIEPIKSQLAHMDEVLSAVKGIQSAETQFQQDIIERMRNLENTILEMRAAAAAAPSQQPPAPVAPAPVQALSAPAPQPPAIPAPAPIPQQPAAPLQTPGTGKSYTSIFSTVPATPAKETATKTEIIDQGSQAKKPMDMMKMSIIGGVALVVIVGGWMIFRKKDTSSAPSTEAAATVVETSTQTLTAAVTAQPVEPVKKDVSQEAINFAKSYPAKEGPSVLENAITEDAAAKKGDTAKISWEAKALPENIFEISAIIPAGAEKEPLVYTYQVDYNQKTIKSMNPTGKTPLDAIMGIKEKPKTAAIKGKGKKGRKTAAAAPIKAPKPAVKPKPQAASEEDEYEYVYEDEESGSEE